MPKISDSLMLRGNITVGATEAVQKSAAKTYLKIISNYNYQVKEQRNIPNTAAIATKIAIEKKSGRSKHETSILSLHYSIEKGDLKEVEWCWI